MKKKHIPLAALAYFVLLLPGIIIPMLKLGLVSRLHKQLSFNLSGPLALSAAMCLFSNMSFRKEQIWHLILLLAAPVLGIAGITLFFTLNASEEELVFHTQSNKLTSGGFGPNQVSCMLGLGAVLMLLYIAAEDIRMRRKVLISGALSLCIVQSVMTFSRSGLYAAVGAFLPALFFLLRVPRIRARVAYLGIIGTALAFFLVIPYLIWFTGGAIRDRFESTKLTGRDRLIMVDIDLWKKNPIYGVGVGMSAWHHHRRIATHNEMTRLLAEHGLFGIAAMLCLVSFGLHRVVRARSTLEKAFIAVTFTWSILFLGADGFRVAAPAFILGLGCATVHFGGDVPPLRRRIANPRPRSLLRPQPVYERGTVS